ncbi:hypothetical protein BS297_27315 [Rhodococcus erythropolis]|uniref:RidA family protein n=1 Tax=Rhodococcus erythropolis TaxID=1833 RepID=A0A5N5DWN5_RHOER|nr:hypothetical protein BS297_27315 [Rhodococcus erythropolis]
MRKNYSSGLEMEAQVGYSRAVQVGGSLYVSATAPVDDDQNLVGSTGYQQAQFALQKIEKTLRAAAFNLDDVVFVRFYFSPKIVHGDAYRAFTEKFSDIRPAIAVVNVNSWSIPNMLLEIEVQAHRDL